MDDDSARVCQKCGRRGKRQCMALDGAICSICCGTSRGSVLECPATCPHFPFGTQANEIWQNLCAAWYAKAQNYVVGAIGDEEFEELVKRFDTEAAEDGEARRERAGFYAVHYALSAGTESAGRPLGEQWEAQGWPGLDNDEKQMAACRWHTWPTVIEVTQILDDHLSECLDLLQPDKGCFPLYGWDEAETGSRFLAWVTPYYHFLGVSGDSLPIEDSLCAPFLDALHEEVPSKDVSESKQYVADHFLDCCRCLLDRLPGAEGSSEADAASPMPPEDSEKQEHKPASGKKATRPSRALDEEGRRRMQEFYHDHYQRFLDRTSPSLNDLSPRQAANDADMRLVLLPLLAMHVDALARKSGDEGVELSIDWVLEELRVDASELQEYARA